jgi:cob(I)alamin adenosyltransferase
MSAKSSAPESEEELARHAEKKAKQKAARDRMLAKRQGEKGLLLVHTGAGKGKTTAAIGLILRALGNGMRVGLVQYVKGRWPSGERAALARFSDLLTIKLMGEGFTWETQDRERDRAAAERAFAASVAFLTDPHIALVVLDELNIVLRDGILPIEPVLEALAKRPPAQHVVITGRNAPPALIEAADLVTEMTLVKHPFRAGIKAQKGIEF